MEVIHPNRPVSFVGDPRQVRREKGVDLHPVFLSEAQPPGLSLARVPAAPGALPRG